MKICNRHTCEKAFGFVGKKYMKKRKLFANGILMIASQKRTGNSE